MSIWVPGLVHCQDGFDAAHCPDPIPKGFEVAMVYAGGSSATHAWDDAEIARVAGLRKAPVWVPTPGTDDPVSVAQEFVVWLSGNKVPHGSHVVWDLETGREPDPKWYNAAAAVTAKAGYLNVGYGSLSVIFGQPVRSGYWVANPTGSPHMYSHPGVKATQYAFDVKVPGGVIDQSLVSVELANGLWR